MLERKNIDRVFQENLKDLEVYPNKRVWNNIEAKLSGRPSKPAVALWKKLSGAAVMLVALITTGLFYFNDSKVIPVNSQVSKTDAVTIDQSVETKLTPIFTNEQTQLVDNNKDKNTTRKTEKPIFIKKPSNKVIVTTNEIATMYSTIENKYVVDKNDFLDELKATESITAKMERIPDKITTQNTIDKKWSVGPTVAPVFYNSLQNGSPLNNALSNNTKTSDNALSIGVKVNYQLSNKFFIQSGVNKVELAYNTKNVNALISSSKNALSNINTDKPGVILTPVGIGRSNGVGTQLNKSTVSGDLNQSIEYFELPIEMKYNLYDKRIGLNVVGGFSTLILSNNSLSMITQSEVTDLGNANNLNDLNFSGNLGVDFDYKISKSWYLNVAPMFKYQFNTYSGNSGNFRPYYFGLYSGLNYKF
ncbi:hypothetical protein [Lutimonas vermicola]|uniref:Outer membrane protein beta-barrel domain-containing protein n=1 Tax=Lutimonas vermicola TaxID=414288 RepID=A0ABU9L2S3_9FLAO